MKKQDLITILFTFVCGFMAGTYLFFVGFQPQVERVTTELLPPPDPTRIITIEGYQYGGCERSGRCASFRIDDAGDYSYVSTSVPTGDGPVTGSLLRRDWRDIRAFLSSEVLAANAAPFIPERCASSYDLVDYRYVIEFGGERYELDTCGTALDRTGELSLLLDGLWQFLLEDTSQR